MAETGFHNFRIWWPRWILKKQKNIFCWKICLQASLNLLAYTIFWDKISLIYSWLSSQSHYSSWESFFQQPQNSPKPALIHYHVLQWVLLNFFIWSFLFFFQQTYSCLMFVAKQFNFSLIWPQHDSNCNFTTLVDFLDLMGCIWKVFFERVPIIFLTIDYSRYLDQNKPIKWLFFCIFLNISYKPFCLQTATVCNQIDI